MNGLELRLQAIERDQQRSRRAHRILIVLLPAFAFIAGAQARVPEASKSATPQDVQPVKATESNGRTPDGGKRVRVVEADQFVLVDHLGRARIRMAIVDNGPSICVLDENGHKRIELSQANTSSSISLLDSEESPAVALQLPSDGGSAGLEIRSTQGRARIEAQGVSIQDSANQQRLHFALINGSVASLGLSEPGQSGPSSIEMTASGGSRSLKIHDDGGYPLFSVFAGEGATSVAMRHPDHERSLEMSIGANDVDGPAIAFVAPQNDDGSGGVLPFLRLGLLKDRKPYVRIVDKNGRTQFIAPAGNN